MLNVWQTLNILINMAFTNIIVGAKKQMSDLPPKHIVSTYKNSSDLDLDSRKAMIRLIEKIVFNLLHAKDFYLANKLEPMSDHIGNSLKILALVRVTLRDENLDTTDPDTLKLAAYLSDFYRDIYIRMANILLSKNVVAEYDSLLKILREHHAIWVGPAEKKSTSAQPDTGNNNSPTQSNTSGSSTFYA